MAISYHDGDFRLTPIEDYRGLGYIHTFCYATTIDEALGFVRTYFTKGYDALFSAMLNSRLEEADQGKFISVGQMKARLNRSLMRWSKQKRKPLEIPPSLAATVELSPEAKLEQQKMIDSLLAEGDLLRGKKFPVATAKKGRRVKS